MQTTGHINLDPTEEIKKNHQLMRKAICELLFYVRDKEKPSKIKVLDVGSGRGELLKDMAENDFECSGIDMSQACVDLGKRYAQCLKMDATDIDKNFKKNDFDIVIASHILEHMENPKQFVEKMKQISKKWLIIAVPNLAQIVTLNRTKNVNYVNRTHICGWDSVHLKTFLEYACQLKIEKWQANKVRIPNRFKFLNVFKIREKLENKILPKKFPFLSHSLICLCRK